MIKSNILPALLELIKYRFYERKSSTLLTLALSGTGAAGIVCFMYGMNALMAIILSILSTVFILSVYFRYPLFGLCFITLFSSLFALPGRILNIQSPIGILVEVFTYILWIAVLPKSTKNKTNNYSFWSNPMTAVMVILMLYYLLEVANQAVLNKIGWFFFVRKQVSYLLVYFIAFKVLDSYEKIKSYLKFWLAFALLIAVYGIKQQWFGLAKFEELWLNSDPLLMKLYFQSGFLRKFSFLTDPAAFGILCSCFGLFTLVLAIRTQQKGTKYLLFLATMIFLFATAYSGTRTCFLMIGAGFLAYFILTINEKKTYILLTIASVLTVILLLVPSQDLPVLNRVKTILAGSKEPSMSVRNTNRHKIQPYIRSHPFGGGLNTSGIEGELYNPGHPLAGFPPDSGYMKILLEQGWIGFAINLIFYFIILKEGISGFYNSGKTTIKTIFIALTISLFALVVGQYSQNSISQYPIILFYYAALAIFIKLKDYDDSKDLFEI